MKQTPDKMRAFLTLLRKRLNFRSLVVTLAAIVVFTTTYLLILPAITLEKDEAVQQGGIDVAVEQSVDGTAEQAVEEPAEDAVVKTEKSVDEDTKGEAEKTKADESKDKATPDKKEVKLLAKSKKLTSEPDESAGFTVSAFVDKNNKVPADVSIQATELTKDTEGFDYDKYYEDALEALKKDDNSINNINMIRFYDISLESETQEKSVEPEDTVSVKIAYDEGIKVSDAENIRIVHFAAQENGKEKAVVLDKKDNKVEATVDGKSQLTEAAFETDGFSVYAVVDEGDQGEYARMNLHFMNGTNEVAMMIVKNGDTREELNTIVYDPGVGDIPAGTIFKGWSTSASYTVDDAEDGMDIVEVRDWAAARTITENEDVYIYAMLYKNYVMNYLDENNVGVGSENVLMLASETSAPYTVNMGYTPKDDTHAFQGWNVTSGGSNIAGHTEGKLYQNGTAITVSGNVTFSVNAPEGHWLVFNENGKGATYNAPRFLEINDVTQKPVADSAMTRFGYTFGGWYDTKEHADAHGANPSVTTGAFQFGNTISDRTTIYASWIPARTANYTVIIWLQNVSGEGYDFEESINLTGNTGTTVNTVTQQGTGNNAYARVNGTNKRYTGFHLDDFDRNVTITPEGNAVLNIYYDRNSHTFTFVDNSNPVETYTKIAANQVSTSGAYYYYGPNHEQVYLRRNNGRIQMYYYGWNNVGNNFDLNEIYSRSSTTTIHTITALFGQDISDIWSFTGDNGKTYPQTNPVTSWTPSGSSTYTARITRMEVMPDENITFTHTTTTNTTRYFHYYVEALEGEQNTRTYNGNQYSLYTDLPNDFNVVYYNDDFWELNGFTRQAITKSNNQNVNLTAGGTVQWTTLNNNYGGTDNHLYFYYTRDKYVINYMDGVYIDGNGNRITTEASRGQLDTSDKIYFNADISSYGKKNGVEGENYYKPIYSGYVFEGWYSDDACTHEYDFNRMPGSNITVYAKWRQVQYRVFLHPNADHIADLDWGHDDQQMNFRVSLGGTVSTPTGRSTEYEFVGWYTDPSCTAQYLFASDTVLNEATVTAAYDKTRDFTDPTDKWGNGATTNGDLDRFWITKKFDLYGKWRAKLVGANGIGVIYDLNGGSGNISDNNLYLDKALATAQAAPTAPADKQFVRWVVQTWDENHVNDDGTSGAYVDTDIYAYPGDTFEVLKDNAKYVVVERDPDTGEVTKATYTVQLKAEYISIENEEPTHINWYGSNETAKEALSDTSNFGRETTNIMINEAVPVKPADTFTYKGHKFLGWARVPISKADGSALDTPIEDQLDGKSLNLTEADLFLKWDPTYDNPNGSKGAYLATSNTESASAGTKVSYVAADERMPYHAMVAVWEKATYPVTIYKNVEGSEEDLAKTFTITTESDVVVDGNDPFANTFGLRNYTEDQPDKGELTKVPYEAKVTVDENNADQYIVEITAKKKNAEGEWETLASSSDTDAQFEITAETEIFVKNTRKLADITIVKLDDKGTEIPGAKFELYNNDGASPVLVDFENAENGIVDLSTRTSVTVKGVTSGNYILRETNAPDGYILLDKDVEFDVDPTGSTVITLASGTQNATTDGAKKDTLKVTNTPGQELPMTGGIGTTIFYILGSILVVGCGVVLVARKRMRIRK